VKLNINDRYEMTPSRDVNRLIEIMAALRTPKTGCPWDLEQNFGTIAPYTIEEAYEVADAIARDDLDDLREELGDLLLQVVFHARMAEEEKAFDFGDVVTAITDKLIRRHPHVFGDTAGPTTQEQVKGTWDVIKKQEKAERAARNPHREGAESSLLASVKAGVPALMRAYELQKKVATVGFDWREPGPVVDKIREETDEIEAALASGDRGKIAEEIGDLMFTAINLARVSGVDPESALRATNAKFERRFAYVENRIVAQARKLDDVSLDEMDKLWDEAKANGVGLGHFSGFQKK
jgi:nucleoside triphosphate diphosphatase